MQTTSIYCPAHLNCWVRKYSFCLYLVVSLVAIAGGSSKQGLDPVSALFGVKSVITVLMRLKYPVPLW